MKNLLNQFVIIGLNKQLNCNHSLCGKEFLNNFQANAHSQNN